MERSGTVDKGVVVQSQAVPLARSNDLAILGKPHSERGTSVHPKVEAERPSGRITVASVLQLVEAQGYRCAMTGRSLSPETASLDHIVPVRLGGGHVVENVQVLHKDVNRAKSTLTNDEFIRLCRDVVSHTAGQDL